MIAWLEEASLWFAAGAIFAVLFDIKITPSRWLARKLHRS